ncbi:MAG: hypothetical protein IT373_30475, partial [Polyangiaceae bacterium]|nr:hypothetical protein [Polyangiaceae bacterium]
MARLRLSIAGLGIGAAWIALAAACLLPAAGLVDAAAGPGGSGGAGGAGGSGPADVTDLVVGWTTSCVVASGSPYCWGENEWGTVGSGDQVPA